MYKSAKVNNNDYVSLVDITTLADNFNISFPFIFRKFLSKFSGTSVDTTVQIPLSDTELSELDSILDIDQIRPLYLVLQDKFGYNNKLIPFAKDKNGNIYALDYTFVIGTVEPQVVYLYMEEKNIQRVASNFENFINLYFTDNCVNIFSEDKLIQKKISPYKDISTNSLNLQSIEDLINQLQVKEEKGDTHNFVDICNKIRHLINKEFNCNCESVFITNTSKNEFFGAAIYPTVDEMNKMIDDIITLDNKKIKFQRCSGFVIEIDSKLLYDMGLSPRDIVACILHEIGHKVFAKEAKMSSILNISASLIGHTANITLNVFKLLQPLRFILYTAIISFFSSSFKYFNTIKDEMNADSLAVRYGYGQSLYNALTKIEDLKLNKPKNDQKKEQKIFIEWSVGNIFMFNQRRNKILAELKKVVKDPDLSAYERRIIVEQINEIEKMKKPIMTMSESYNSYSEEMILSESLDSFIRDIITGKAVKSLDVLSLEIDEIEDNEDKMYVTLGLHKLRKKAINYQIKLKQLLDKGKITQSDYDKKYAVLQSYIDQIEDRRKDLLKVKVKEKTYGVFAKISIDEYDAL